MTSESVGTGKPADPAPAVEGLPSAGWSRWSMRERVWSVVGGSAALATFCVVLPVLAYQGQLPGEWLIKLLALLFSWPVAAVLMACIIIPKFQGPISAYLDRATEVKVFNASILAAPQQPGPSLIVSSDTNENASSAALLSGSASAGEVQKWKFDYANLFLVPRTQQLLNWIEQNSPTSAEAIQAYWSFFVGVPQQGVMLLALKSLKFIEDDGLSFRISDEGRAFLTVAAHARSAIVPALAPALAPLPPITGNSVARIPFGSPGLSSEATGRLLDALKGKV